MKAKIKSIISISILILLISICIFYIYQNKESFKQLTLVNPYHIIILILLFILNYVFVGITTKELLKPFSINLSIKESFQLSIITGFYNLITPFRGGMAARAVYLKKKYDFPYTNFFSTLSASYVIIFLIAGFTGILSTLIIYYQEKMFSWILFFLFIIVFISSLVIIIFSPKFPETKNNFINKFIKILNGWHLIKDNSRVIFVIFSITLIQTVLAVISTYLSFQVFGIDISISKCLFLLSVGYLSVVIAITPANLGVGEAIGIFSAMTIGITPVQSITVSLLGRAISFLVLFTIGPLFSYYLLKKVK